MAIAVTLIILVYVLYLIFKKEDRYIPSYSYGWGTNLALDLSLTKKEVRILNYISYRRPYERLDYVLFYKKELIGFYISILRGLLDKNIGRKRYKDLFYYCDYILRQKYNCVLPKVDSIIYLESVLSDLDKNTIREISANIRGLTEDEEKVLFREDNTRWERNYNQFIEDYSIGDVFYENVVRLEYLCSNLTIKRNMYHKAYRFVADKDRLVSLKLYIHYLSIVSESETFKHSNISRTNQKLLFESNIQKEKYFNLVETFKQDSDLEKALAGVDSVFKVERRKIKLDENEIRSAKKDLNKVVGLLNDYLDDEFVADNKKEEVKEDVSQQNVQAEPESPRNELMKLFVDNGYKLSIQEIDIFANQRGLFKSQLIEGINEDFYEILDDLLIGEEDEDYILNKEYYAKIKA